MKNQYKTELERYNQYSNITLNHSKNNFKIHMNKKQKIVFDYLMEELEKNEIVYKFSSQLNIILKDNNYFYFELFDDLSTDFINFENKQEDIQFKFKTDVDRFIKRIVEVKK